MPKSTLTASLILASGLFASAAMAQTAAPRPANPAPRPAASAARPAARSVAAPAPAHAPGALDIKGFRTANFGFTEAQVRNSIATDLPGAKITDGIDPAAGTRYIQATVDQLDPGPGAAVVTYIFGAASKTLFNIDVSWTLPGEPSVSQREQVFIAGQQLVSYFQAQPAPAKASQGASSTGPNGLILYAAVDSKNAGEQVSVDGVSFQHTEAGSTKPISSPTPTGPAVLRVIYVLNADVPDVKTIKPGSF